MYTIFIIRIQGKYIPKTIILNTQYIFIAKSYFCNSNTTTNIEKYIINRLIEENFFDILFNIDFQNNVYILYFVQFIID